MLKIFFYHKSEKSNWKNESPIYARLWYNQNSVTITTGKYITKERWESTNKLRNVLRLEREQVLRKALDLFQISIEKKFNEIIQRDPDNFSLVKLKNEITGKTNEMTVLEVLEIHIQYFKKKVAINERSYASLQKYCRSKELLISFLEKEYKREDISCKLINSPFVYNLESFLKYESNFKGRIGIKNNSAVKYMHMYKTAFNYAIKMAQATTNPFDIYDGKINLKNSIFLTSEELHKIEKEKILNRKLQKVKDIFLFCCYTGYAPIDASSLTTDNLIMDNNNHPWIQTNRLKTDIKSNVPLLPPAYKIIKKYKNQYGQLLPTISNQKMNEYLKELAVLCGINKHLTWYVARHTFATTITLGNGVRIENVSSMMGHTNILQTQHYAKILDVNVKDDMSKLIKKYKNK